MSDIRRRQGGSQPASGQMLANNRGATQNTPSNVVEIFDAPDAAQNAPRGELADADYSKQLLASARQFMREGRFDDARDAAFKASRYDVEYGLFDDSPEAVLRDIDRQSGTVTLTAQTPPAAVATLPEIEPSRDSEQRLAGPATQVQASAAQARTQAQQLLRSARDVMKTGDLAKARDLVSQAESLNATYSLFDERPEIVLADIARLSQATSPTAAAPPAAAPAQPASRNVVAVPNDVPLMPDSLNPVTRTGGSSNPLLPATLASTENAPVARSPKSLPLETTPAPAAVSPGSADRAQKAAGLLAEARSLIQAGDL